MLRWNGTTHDYPSVRYLLFILYYSNIIQNLTFNHHGTQRSKTIDHFLVVVFDLYVVLCSYA